MPEPPDFEQLAREIFRDYIPTGDAGNAEIEQGISDLVDELRKVWNTRGAADAHAVEERLATLTGWVSSEPYRQHLREAITGLNR